MTILSKKKPSQGKPEPESPESTNHHAGTHPHSHQLGSMPNHSQQSNEPLNHDRLGSPLCWPLQREEKRPQLNNSSHESGPSHSKRRHRASPHRTTRSKLRDRERNSATSPPPSSSPKAGPSDSQHLEDYNSSSCGYNSGDEYGFCESQDLTEAEWLERDRRFEKLMRKRGFIIKQMGQDGACLFRSVADQVYGDQEMHAVVRNHCMDYIAANRDFFSQYLTEDVGSYVNRKRKHNVHGNHIEMQAMSEMYNRPVEVFCYRSDPINTFHGMHKTDNEPIRLSYQRGSHYNSIVDPYKATIGVGLGLPGYSPGAADRNLIKDATRHSEELAIEQTMLEDKLRATDWEATNEAIEEQVARDSYLQWIKDNEKRNKALRSATATSSATVTSLELRQSPRQSPRSRLSVSTPPRTSPRASPRSSPCSSREDPSNSVASTSTSNDTSACSTSTNQSEGDNNGNPVTSSPRRENIRHIEGFQLMETASFLNLLPPEMFGLSEWDDAGILAQVLATSQQEYMDELKKRSHSDDPQPSTSYSCPSTSSAVNVYDCEAGPSTR